MDIQKTLKAGLCWFLFCGFLTLSLTACPKKQTVKKTPAEEEQAQETDEVKSDLVDGVTLDLVGKPYSQTSSSETTLPSLSYLRMIFFLGWEVV